MDGLERLEDGALRRLHGISAGEAKGIGGEEIMPPGTDPAKWDAYLADRARMRNEKRAQLVGGQSHPQGPDGYAHGAAEFAAAQQQRASLFDDTSGARLDELRGRISGKTRGERIKSAQDQGIYHETSALTSKLAQSRGQEYDPQRGFSPPAFDPSAVPVPAGPGSGRAGPNPGRGLTPQERGQVPDGKGGQRPGSAIGGVPSLDVMNQLQAGAAQPRPRNYNGQTVGDAARFDPQTPGTTRNAVGVPGGGTMVADTPRDPSAGRFGTFQNKDGTFSGIGASGNHGGFKTEEEAKAWSLANFDPAGSPAPAAPPAAQPAQPAVVQAPAAPAIAPNPQAGPKGSSLTNSFFDPGAVPQEPSRLAGGGVQLGRGGEAIKEFAGGVMDSIARGRERMEEGRARVYGPAGSERPPPAEPRVTPADRFGNWIQGLGQPAKPQVAQVTAPSEIRTGPDFGDPTKDAERPRKRRDQRVAQTSYGF